MRSRFGKSLVFRTFPRTRQGHGTQRLRHTTRENKLAPRSLLMLTGHYQITWTQREAMPKPCAVSSVVDAAIDQFSLPTFLACLFIAGPFFFSFSQFLAFLLVLAALSSPGLLATATFLGALWPRAPVAVCGCWSSEESLVSVRTASSQSGPWGVRVIDEYSPESQITCSSATLLLALLLFAVFTKIGAVLPAVCGRGVGTSSGPRSNIVFPTRSTAFGPLRPLGIATILWLKWHEIKQICAKFRHILHELRKKSTVCQIPPLTKSMLINLCGRRVISRLTNRGGGMGGGYYVLSISIDSTVVTWTALGVARVLFNLVSQSRAIFATMLARRVRARSFPRVISTPTALRALTPRPPFA